MIPWLPPSDATIRGATGSGRHVSKQQAEWRSNNHLPPTRAITTTTTTTNYIRTIWPVGCPSHTRGHHHLPRSTPRAPEIVAQKAWSDGWNRWTMGWGNGHQHIMQSTIFNIMSLSLWYIIYIYYVFFFLIFIHSTRCDALQWWIIVAGSCPVRGSGGSGLAGWALGFVVELAVTFWAPTELNQKIPKQTTFYSIFVYHVSISLGLWIDETGVHAC